MEVTSPQHCGILLVRNKIFKRSGFYRAVNVRRQESRGPFYKLPTTNNDDDDREKEEEEEEQEEEDEEEEDEEEEKKKQKKLDPHFLS